jgi:hypothetical protein
LLANNAPVSPLKSSSVSSADGKPSTGISRRRWRRNDDGGHHGCCLPRVPSPVVAVSPASAGWGTWHTGARNVATLDARGVNASSFPAVRARLVVGGPQGIDASDRQGPRRY